MPPRPAPNDEKFQTAFARAHPILNELLMTSGALSPALLLTATLWAAGFLKRPLWERKLFWRAALVSYLSRWAVVGCTITWLMCEWGEAGEE
jgi:hypothetical protein